MNGNVAAALELMAVRRAWRALVVEWALTWRERRDLLPAGGDDAAAPPGDTEHRMRILVEIGHRLRFGDDETLWDWLRAPLEVLNWHSPLEAMSSTLSDLRRLRVLVEQGLAA